MWGVAISVLACGAAACSLLPRPAPVRTWRAVAAMCMTVLLAWIVLAALLTGAQQALPPALILAGVLALVAQRASGDAQGAAWIGTLAGALILLAGSILALRILEPVVASTAIALASGALIAGSRPGRASARIVMRAWIVLPAWLAWGQGMLDLPGGRGPSVACFLAVTSLGFMVLALRGQGRWAIAAWAGTAETALLIAIGPGASLGAILAVTLALAVVILALLRGSGQITRLMVRQWLAALTLAVGVASLLSIGWSLLLGEGIGPGWAAVAAALGWLLFPSPRQL